jgi:hypothetical protein
MYIQKHGVEFLFGKIDERLAALGQCERLDFATAQNFLNQLAS